MTKKKSEVSKPIKKEWKKDYKLLTVEYPKEPSYKNARTRYETVLTYEDNNGIRHKKRVRFGRKDREEFVDNGDINKRALNLMRIKNADKLDVLDPNYWRVCLLNTCGSLKEAYKNYVVNSL